MPKINLANLGSEKPERKYHTAKQAIALSERQPAALYPKFGVFLRLLDGENRVLRWVSLIVIGNLARADTQNRIVRLLPKFRNFVRGKEFITAANAIKALGEIGVAKPRSRNAIATILLGVESAHYDNKGKPSPECRNIAIGHAITALGGFSEAVKKKPAVVAFLRRQTKNPRPATRRKAKQLLATLQ